MAAGRALGDVAGGLATSTPLTDWRERPRAKHTTGHSPASYCTPQRSGGRKDRETAEAENGAAADGLSRCS